MTHNEYVQMLQQALLEAAHAATKDGDHDTAAELIQRALNLNSLKEEQGS